MLDAEGAYLQDASAARPVTKHLTLDDTRSYRDAAQHILTRYTTRGAEANTTAAIRDFFIEVCLVRQEDTNQEAHPAEGSTKAADLGISDRHLFFEVKPRIGTGGDSSKPAPGNLEQIDNYVRIAGPPCIGVLTDGKHWILRTTRDEPNKVRGEPYRFTLESAEQWYALYEWLRDYVFTLPRLRPCSLESLRVGFGPGSPTYDRHIAAIAGLYEANKDLPTVKVKRELWETLLGVALGEIAGVDIDDLFVRHTYLTTIVGMITQAVFGLDIAERAATDGQFHRSVHGSGHDDRCPLKHRPMEVPACQAHRWRCTNARRSAAR